MTSEDFAKIFYSNFTPNIDWANIDEITWMHEEGLFTFLSKVIASHNEFMKKIDFVLNPKNGFIRSGEGYEHLSLKCFATDYLVRYYDVPEQEIRDEYPLIGFEVDIIDKDLRYPTECGDTNALKLEKYLSLSTTNKVLVMPYPRLEEVKIFEFCANPRFFEYIQHKRKFLNQKLAKLR